MPTRAAKRRGAGGWPGWAAMGWSTRRGGYAGCQRLRAVQPWGRSTGCGCGAASTQAHPLAETCLALRRYPPPGLARVGAPASGPHDGAQGGEGHAHQQPWGSAYGAQVLCPPPCTSRVPWPKRLRRWRAGGRQSVETVEEQRWHTCRRERERPHDRSGVQARVAAKIALHHCCIGLNEQLGRPRLAFADLLAW